MTLWRETRMRALAGGQRLQPRFRAEVGDSKTDIYIHDVIDPWGGYWGVSAGEVIAALQGAGDVTVHINSPGGDVFEALAIFSTFKQHKGNVTMRVEALAASAASMIMLAGDETIIDPNAMVMIHDAWGVSIGNAAEMHKYADLLDKTSQNIATMYQAKAGGDAGAWRALMQEETWYVGPEAVEAGLADSVVAAQGAATESADAVAWDVHSLFAKAPRPAGDGKDQAADVSPPIVPVGEPFAAGRITDVLEPATSGETFSIPDFDRIRAALKGLKV